jgi:hypothetical protein
MRGPRPQASGLRRAPAAVARRPSRRSHLAGLVSSPARASGAMYRLGGLEASRINFLRIATDDQLLEMQTREGACRQAFHQWPCGDRRGAPGPSAKVMRDAWRDGLLSEKQTSPTAASM